VRTKSEDPHATVHLFICPAFLFIHVLVFALFFLLKEIPHLLSYNCFVVKRHSHPSLESYDPAIRPAVAQILPNSHRYLQKVYVYMLT